MKEGKLTYSNDPIRYYMIDLDKIELMTLKNKRSGIIQYRPTRWRKFLCGILTCGHRMGFVRLPESVIKNFLDYRVAATAVGSTKVKINGFTAMIEPWNIGNVFKFCIESFQFGTFWRFWRWRW